MALLTVPLAFTFLGTPEENGQADPLVLLDGVRRYAERLAFIHDGQLTEGTAGEMLTQERLQELYGIPVRVGELAGHRVVSPADLPPPGGAA